MARPEKQDGEKRSETARFRLTLAEREWLREQAGRAGLSETEFMRRRVLGRPIPPAPSRSSDPALVSELNRIGVNVNQLARATHRGSDFVRYWNAVGEELRNVLGKVMAHGS